MPLIVPTIFTAKDSGYLSLVDKMSKQTSNLKTELVSLAKDALIGGGIVGGFSLAIKSAMDFEDKMADISKTTGASGASLNKIGDAILAYSKKTRTSISDLQDIAAGGGALGIKASEIAKYTETVDKFSVALGSDFAGGVTEATKAVSGLHLLFKQTRDLDISSSINKTGSAINDLSSKGVGVANLTDFASRLGQLPDAIKPAITDVLALGGVLDKAGLQSEISARGLGDILLTASKNLPGFAKQIGTTAQGLREMINTNPTQFLSKFSASFKGLDAVKTAKLLDKLKLGDSGTIKVVGALSNATEQLAQFQTISNNAFEKGTSLLSEFNTKNQTTAGGFAQIKNSLQALAIEIGSKLLPVIIFFADHLEAITTASLAFIAVLGTWKLSVLAANAVSKIFFLVDMIKYIASTHGITIAQAAWGIVISSLKAPMLALNLAMSSTPFGIFIAGIGLLITAYALWKSSVESVEAKENRLKNGIIQGTAEQVEAVKLITDAYVKQGDAIDAATHKAKIAALQEIMFDIDRQKALISGASDDQMAQIRQNLSDLQARANSITGKGTHIAYTDEEKEAEALAKVNSTSYNFAYQTAAANNNKDNTLHIIVNDPSNQITVVPDKSNAVKIKTTTTFATAGIG